VRAAAEVIAKALYSSRRHTWEQQPREIQDDLIDRAEPLAEEVLRAAEKAR
jgi:hypothetical protein